MPEAGTNYPTSHNPLHAHLGHFRRFRSAEALWNRTPWNKCPICISSLNPGGMETTLKKVCVRPYGRADAQSSEVEK